LSANSWLNPEAVKINSVFWRLDNSMNADDLHQSFGGKKRYNDFRIIKISSNHSLLLKSESGIVEVEAIPVNELK